jgi:23S rRNA-/tRNA-specific pseudouridylate synthase
MSAIIDTFIAPPCFAEIEILWQDDDLILINKPSGLLSLSGKNRKTSILSTTVWYRPSPAARWCIVLISAPPG